LQIQNIEVILKDIDEYAEEKKIGNIMTKRIDNYREKFRILSNEYPNWDKMRRKARKKISNLNELLTQIWDKLSGKNKKSNNESNSNKSSKKQPLITIQKIRDLDLLYTNDLKFPYLKFKKKENQIENVIFKVRWNGVEEKKNWQIADQSLLK